MENSNSQFILIIIFKVCHFCHWFRFNAKETFRTAKLLFCMNHIIFTWYVYGIIISSCRNCHLTLPLIYIATKIKEFKFFRIPWKTVLPLNTEYIKESEDRTFYSFDEIWYCLRKIRQIFKLFENSTKHLNIFAS